MESQPNGNLRSGRRRGLLWWLPPSAAAYIYTVLLKPAPIRRLAQSAIRLLIPKEVEIHGSTLVLNQQDAIVSGTVALGCYEPFNLEFFQSLLKPGMCVVDVGANIGLYTAIGAAVVGPAGMVVAVEPGAENCAFIRKTIKRNAFSCVSVVQKAAGERCGPAALFLCETNKADHRVYDISGDRERIEIEMITLDFLMKELNAVAVDVLKIDTQGFESFVLQGMDLMLRESPKIKILIEYWPWGIRQTGRSPTLLLEQFLEYGFQIFEIDGDHHKLVPINSIASLAHLEKERQHTNLFLERAP